MAPPSVYNQDNLLTSSHSRKNFKIPRSSNNINSHEENILSTLDAAKKRQNKVIKRLQTFQKRFDNEDKAKAKIKWIRQYKNVKEEELVVSRLIKSIVESLSSVVELGKDFTKDTCKIEGPTKERFCCLKNMQMKSKSDVDLLRLQNVHNECNKEIQVLSNQCKQLEKDISSRNFENSFELSPERQSIVEIIVQKINNVDAVSRCAMDLKLITERDYHKIGHTVAQICDYDFQNADSIEMTSKYHADTSIYNNVCNAWKVLFDNRLINEKEIKESVVDMLKKLEELTGNVMEVPWTYGTQSASEALEAEKKFRNDSLRQMRDLNESIEKQKISHRDDLNEEERKEYRERKLRQRQIIRKELEEYHFAKKTEQLEAQQAIQKKLHDEEETRKTRLLINGKRYETRTMILLLVIYDFLCSIYLYLSFSRSIRVQFRQEELVKKQKNILIAADNEKKMKIDRQKKLNEIAALVPYYSSIKNKKADLTKSTAARANDIFESSCDKDLMDFQQGLKKLNGFSDKKVFSDPKFRLAHALHESGKANSAYSLAIVNRLIPRKLDRVTDHL